MNIIRWALSERRALIYDDWSKISETWVEPPLILLDHLKLQLKKRQKSDKTDNRLAIELWNNIVKLKGQKVKRVSGRYK